MALQPWEHTNLYPQATGAAGNPTEHRDEPAIYAETSPHLSSA